MMFDETVPRLENVLLILVFVGSVDGQCVSQSPIAGSCFCHFIGACDWTQTPPVPFANATNALPTNIVQNFANAPNSAVTICEGRLGSLAIMYDCDLRIPLYAARILTDADILTSYDSDDRSGSFRETRNVDNLYRQKNGDYGTNAKDQIPCYEGNPPPTMYFDHDWYPAANKYGTAPQVCKPKILAAKNIKCTIHKGHLIASSYGKAAVNMIRSIKDTFVLSNVVPQFGDMNSGAWNKNEQILLNWAESKCSSFNAGRRNARLFIVVGILNYIYIYIY